MTELFWRLKPGDMAKLIQYQYEHYGTKLDIASWTPPWHLPDPVPEIPIRTDMTEDELAEFIRQPPEHQACPPELPGNGGREKVT